MSALPIITGKDGRRATVGLAVAFCLAVALLLIATQSAGAGGRADASDIFVVLRNAHAEASEAGTSNRSRSPLPSVEATRTLEAKSAVLLHEEDGATYWLAVDHLTRICAVTELKDGEFWTVAAGCHWPWAVSEDGLELTVTAGSARSQALLVPDQLLTSDTTSAIEAVGGRMPHPNLALFDEVRGTHALEVSDLRGRSRQIELIGE